MKAIKILYTLIVLTSAQSLRADEEQRPAHAYDRFCSRDASENLEKLNNVNKDKLARIVKIKEEMKNLNEHDALIAEAMKVKKNYEGSLNAIAKPTEKSPEEVTEKIGHIRSVMKNGMVIQAITFLLEKQNSKVNPPEVLTLDNLCQNNKDEKICKIEGEDKKHLDVVLAAFQNNSSSLPDNQKKDLQSEVKALFASIPKEIAPDAMLDLIQKESPAILELLKVTDSKEILQQCLSKASAENDNACKIFFSRTGSTKLAEKIVHQTTSLSGKMAQYNDLLNIAVGQNKSQFKKSSGEIGSIVNPKDQMKAVFSEANGLLKRVGKKLEDVNLQKAAEIRLAQANQGKVSSAEKKLQENIILLMAKKLPGMQGLFYSPMTLSQLKEKSLDASNPEHVEKILKLESDAMSQASADEAFFKKSCDFQEVDSKEVDQNIERCKGIMEKILPYVEIAKTKNAEQVRKLADELDKLVDPDFKAVESLKEYMAEKYLCACEKKNPNVQVINCGGDNSLSSIQDLSALQSNTYKIANILYYNNIKVPLNKSEDCDLSNAQLDDFKNSCSNSRVKSEFKGICGPIIAELEMKERKKEQKKTEERNAERMWATNSAKYHYVYDRTSASGYRRIPKQSLAASIVTGVVSIIPQAMYAGLGNMIAKNNIEMLTTQGIYTKQFLHNIEIYNQSPWMYNYNYFTFGNIMGVGTPLTGGTTTGTTGTGFSF